MTPRGSTMTVGNRNRNRDPDAARARRRALRETHATRARKIRRCVVAGALALFVATWLMIAVVLISGHDPALAARKSSTTIGASSSGSPSASAGAGTSASTGSSGSSGTTTSGSSGTTTSGSSGTSVTTRQS